MDVRLFIVVLDSLDNVLYKRYIHLYYNYRYHCITGDSDPIASVFSFDPFLMTTAVFILIKIPVPQMYRGIYRTIIPMQLSCLRSNCMALLQWLQRMRMLQKSLIYMILIFS